MAFNPSSTIFLCNVAIDSTYQNQIYFANRAAQQSYFSGKVVKTFSDYLTVRTTRADGSLQSSVKVNANIDYLRSLPCNYMYYQNAHHGTRIFYAFITKFIYVNEGTTEIVFETDVYQTWMLDCQLKQSYVVREHSETDEIGDNITPEKFCFQDYSYSHVYNDTTLRNWGYLVATTGNNLESTSFWEDLFGGDEVVVQGKPMSGIYQGLFFWYYKSETALNDFLNEIVKEEQDCVVFIAVVPDFCVSANGGGEGLLGSSTAPAQKEITISWGNNMFAFDGYIPRNNKLYTSPFLKLVVCNHSGQEAEYNAEDFLNRDEIKFKMYGDVSANPSITLCPMYYKGLELNYDAGISISGFPQASMNTDTFKLWLAKNQFSTGTGIVAGVGMLAGAVALAVGTGGAGLLAAGSVATGVTTGAGISAGATAGALGFAGANTVLNTIGNVYTASQEPNRAEGGNTRNNLLTAMGMNKFDFYCKRIKGEYARTVDDFFTMYGYAVNKLKQPNVSSRPVFNYIQTVDVNIVGSIPNDDMLMLKQLYNRGITLWKPNATIGDYSADNTP